jgi:phosphoribosylformylglycinamidine synthase
VSGNVSLYNETNGVAVLPTPVIGMLGLLEDVERRATMAFRDGRVIGLMDGQAQPHGVRDHALLGASQYLETGLGVKAGIPPLIDLDAERMVQYACREAIRQGILDVAHDCSDGGLAVALSEGCIAGGVGAGIRLDDLEQAHQSARSDVLLFAEEPSRIVVALPAERWEHLVRLASSMGISLYRLGEAGGDTFRVERGRHVLIEQPMLDVVAAWRGGLG